MKSVHVLTLGFCALCAQAVFVREIMALFTGTELVIGILLSGWLLWVGLGGLIGGRLVRRHNGGGFTLFARLALVVALLLPVTALAIRFGRGLIAVPPGELPRFSSAIVFSLLAIAPFGFVYGTIYNIASRLWREGEMGIRGGVSRVYIWEAAGSLLGALVFSFVLLPILSQIEAAFTISLMAVAAFVLPRGLRGSLPLSAAAVLVLGLAFVFAAPRLDRCSIEAVYPGYRIDAFLSSRYGEIVAASREEVTSFFSGGGRLFSVPEPERAEEIVHVPLLMHEEPRDVLLLGGSLGGGWEEVVKHRCVERVDCLELDGKLLRLALELRGGTVNTGADSRLPEGIVAVKDGIGFIEGDGRFFLSRGKHKYDVIVLNAPPPINLQWNRYYTKEFFALAKRSLYCGGLFAFSHPSSEDFISDDQARVLRSLEATLKEVFDDVTIVPGSTVHFIAGRKDLDVGTILKRLEERGIETFYVSRDFLPYRLSPERIDFLAGAIGDTERAVINTDTRPALPLYEIVLEGRRIGSGLMGWFETLIDVSAAVPVGLLAGAFIVIFLSAGRRSPARLAVFAVGFGSFLLQLLVLLAYQSFSGLLYHAVVIMTALFMAGASLGARFSFGREIRVRRDLRAIHFCFAVLALFLLGLLHALRAFNVPHAVGASVFMLCSGVGGFLTGSYYPVVVRSALPEDGSQVPATFYAWDLFGACLGGLLGGALLFPVSGVIGTVVLVIFVHAAASALLVGRWSS